MAKFNYKVMLLIAVFLAIWHLGDNIYLAGDGSWNYYSMKPEFVTDQHNEIVKGCASLNFDKISSS